MQREKVESRRAFTKKEKIEVLNKSNDKCVHCGRKLNTNTMTIDHFIPVSEGGTNNKDNLIPLCEECNSTKGAIIYSIDDYCRYLKTGSKARLAGYVREFNEVIQWVTPNNLFQEDIISCNISYDTLSPTSSKIISLNKKVYYTKALYRDLDEIYEFMQRYNDSIHMGCKGRDLKSAISERFTSGVYYLMRDSKDKLQVVFVIEPKVGLNNNNCLYLEVFINQDLKLDPTIKRINTYTPGKALFFYYSGVVYEFLKKLTCQFGVDIIIDYNVLINKKDKYLNSIIHCLTIKDTRDPSVNDKLPYEIVSLVVSSEVDRKDRKSIIKGVEDNSGKFKELYDRGSKLLGESIKNCRKEDDYYLPDLDRCKKESKLLSKLICSFVKRMNASGLSVKGSIDEGYVYVILEHGVLKSVKFALNGIDLGHSRLVVLPVLDSGADEKYYRYDKSLNRHYWYLSDNNIEVVLESLCEFVLLERKSKLSDMGKGGYNRMVYKNSCRNLGDCKSLSNISEYRLYERRIRRR